MSPLQSVKLTAAAAERGRLEAQSKLDAALRREAELQQRLTTADQRNDELETQLADREQSRRAWLDECQGLERAAAPVPPQADAQPVAWRFRVTAGGDWFTTTKQHVAYMYRGTEDGGEVEPLYTRADAGEVARLRSDRESLLAERSKMDRAFTACIEERDTLRAQLADRDAAARNALEVLRRIIESKTAGVQYAAAVAACHQINAALSASAEPAKDDDWHMNPCKQGHLDVGAAGGVAHCYTCDEKITAATTQEAFEQWNATHPAVQP